MTTDPPATDGQESARLDRNWEELLQELRVVQTGVQILTGFLLTVPFSDRFAELTDPQVGWYLGVLTGSVVTTGLVVAPAAFHRVLFRKRRRPWLVSAANQCARLGLATLALTTSGMLFLVFDVVVGTTAAVIALVAVLCFLACVWVTIPLAARHK